MAVDDEALDRVAIAGWISKRVRELHGHRIWWRGKDGASTNVKLVLKEVQIRAGPSTRRGAGPGTLDQEASVTFVPAFREYEDEEEPDEIDQFLWAIFAAEEEGASDEEIEKVWGCLKEAVIETYGECNIIPGEPGAPCRERLVVFPEVVSVLARHRLLPNVLEFCGNELQDLRRRDNGICCALCEATAHVRHCFVPPKWMNRIIDIRGDPRIIKRACSDSVLCRELWNPEDAVRPRGRRMRSQPRVDQPERPVLNEDIYPCWAKFLGAIRSIWGIPDAPAEMPALHLGGRRVL